MIRSRNLLFLHGIIKRKREAVETRFEKDTGLDIDLMFEAEQNFLSGKDIQDRVWGVTR